MRKKDLEQYAFLKYFDISKVAKGGVAKVYIREKKRCAEVIYGLVQLRLLPYVQESLNQGAALPVSQLELMLREAIDAGREDLDWFSLIPKPDGRDGPSMFLKTLEMLEKDGLIVVTPDFLVCKGAAYDAARISVAAENTTSAPSLRP